MEAPLPLCPDGMQISRRLGKALFAKNATWAWVVKRFYFTSGGLLRTFRNSVGLGVARISDRKISVHNRAEQNLRTATGFRHEMNFLLASLCRVEVRIQPQTLTDFLKWKNRMANYNGAPGRPRTFRRRAQ